MSDQKQAPKVALVTGASRGAGKGIAIGLAEKGMTVYVTGRTKRRARTKAGPEKSCRERSTPQPRPAPMLAATALV